MAIRARLLATTMILAASSTPSSLALDPSRPVTQYMVDYWQEHAGLPQKSVTVIRQTRDGYLWIGTKGGLARFDGVRFEVYDDRARNQLEESEVWALAEAEDGSLWIGTYGGGLSLLKNGTFARYSVKDGLPSNFVTALATERDGTLWVGTLGGLAHRRTDGRFEVYGASDGLPSPTIAALHVDERGVLWIGTDRGLASFGGGRLADLSRTHPQLRLPVAVIAGDGQNGLWLGLSQTNTGFGLGRYRAGAVTVYTTAQGLPSNTVTSLALDEGGTLWIGTLAGLCRFHNGRFETYYTKVTGSAAAGALQTVSLSSVQALARDLEGSVWVGTRFDGLMRLRDSAFSTTTGGAEPELDVRTIFADRQGVVWLGTAVGPRYLLNGVWTSLLLPAGLGADALAEDGEGRLWVGTEAGLFDLRDGRLSRAGTKPLDTLTVSALLGDARGRLWIGTRGDGLYRYAGGAVAHYTPQQGLNGSQVRALAQDSRGGIWVGTKNGGVTHIEGDRFRSYGVAEGLATEAVQALFVDRDDVAWAGTRRGLARIKGGRVAMITAQNGLPANYFYQIVEDDHAHLWLTCGSGVVRVSKRTLDAVADGENIRVDAVLFSGESGMRSTVLTVPSQPLAAKTRDGRLWFPTARGAAVVDPAALTRNTFPPPVHVEQLRRNGRLENLADGMTLPAGRCDLEIHYTGLSFVAPELVRFKYLLEGVDVTWQDAGTRRVAYYTNLPPRQYRFRVIAFNSDGVQSEREAALSFRVRPHWTQIGWVRLLAVLILLGLGFAAYRARVAVLRARQLELARLVDERTGDLQREIGQHRLTEVKLRDENEERRRAEEEARVAALKLAEGNRDLLEQKTALARENEERRRAEQAAARERDLLHALMDNTPDLIYFKDRDSRFTRANRAQAQACGAVSPDALVGKSDLDFFPAEFAKATLEDERRLMRTGETVVGHVEHDLRADRWYLATKVPIRDERGVVTGLVGTSKDITERKRAEQSLEHDLQDFLQLVNAISQGDLTRRVNEGEETLGRIGRAINCMLQNFAATLADVRDAALSVSSTATEILAAARHITQGARAGSDEATSTSSAVEEMAASMSQVSKHAKLSADMAHRVFDHLKQSTSSMTASYHGMGKIDEAVSETAAKMRLLEKRSREVFEITELIDDLASQSALLSLNAAIEAAHAGDAGRGFSVVAEEIRHLADRSTQATKSVTGIVEGMLDETRAVLSAMENSMTVVKDGLGVSEAAQKSLREIDTLVQGSADLSGQISSASHEQAQATETVANAMRTIATTTQQSAIGAAETVKAVQDLVLLAERLNESLRRFKIPGSLGREVGA